MFDKGKLIRKRREEAGLTLEELARRVECSKGTMSQIENGRPLARTGFEVVVRIAKVLAINLNDLVDVSHIRSELKSSAVSIRYIPVLSKSEAFRLVESLNSFRNGLKMPVIAIQSDLADTLSLNGFAIKQVGNSMTPDFNDGDQLIIDPDVTPEPGDYILSSIDRLQSSEVRKYRPVSYADGAETADLIATNVDYPIESIVIGVSGGIVGVVVRHIRDPRKK